MAILQALLGPDSRAAYGSSRTSGFRGPMGTHSLVSLLSSSAFHEPLHYRQELADFHVVTMAELGKHFGHFRELNPAGKPVTISNRKVKESSTTKVPCSQRNSGHQMRGCVVSKSWIELGYPKTTLEAEEAAHGGSSCLFPESKCFYYAESLRYPDRLRVVP